jgi:hypothetical protein
LHAQYFMKTQNKRSISPYFAFAGIFLMSLRAFAAAAPAGRVEADLQPEKKSSWLSNFSATYFTFFDGPGLEPGLGSVTPNVLGKPIDDGLRLTNFISLRYKLNPSLALDFQMRIQFIFNNARNLNHFDVFRWQSPRVGISGTLLSGNSWALTGAFNTDLPYFMPQPLGAGTVAQERTTLFTPGLFAKFAYTPKESPWSFFSLVMPRFFLYENRNVAEPQMSRAGFSPQLKNEFIFSISPSVNYALTGSTGLRLGTEFTYSKLILSSWNPFHGSLNNTDLKTDAWRLAAVPIQVGVTHEFSKAFNVSAFVQAFPIAAQRVRQDGSRATFGETASVGMWISGTLI